jgi:hypothetical protein
MLRKKRVILIKGNKIINKVALVLLFLWNTHAKIMDSNATIGKEIKL